MNADDYDSEDQTSCEAMLLFWYPSPGDQVAAGEELAEIETAKAVVVVEAPTTGTLKEILVRAGDAVTPGQRLAVIQCSE